MIQARGRFGSIEFDGETVTIRHRHGIAVRDETVIRREDITSVQLGQVGPFGDYIRFTVPGEPSNAGRTRKDITRDRYALLYRRKDAAAFEALRNALR